MILTDFHAHIIPWADHGSSSIDTSLFQLTLAAEFGIDQIVATPHFYPQQENADRFLSRRNDCYQRLSSHLTAEHPRVILGAEVLICDNIEKMPGIESLCIEGTKTLLLELPFSDFSDSFVHSVKSLIHDGYTVVLAHADRYDQDNIEKLVHAGAKIQLNADSLSGFLVPTHLKRWIYSDKVVAIGSDIHGHDKNAYKRFTKVLRRFADNSEYIMSASKKLLG